jgi:predicted phosphodiesterase
MSRHLELPAKGQVLVSTDVHGNLEDFRRLTRHFLELRDAIPDAYWVILGDIVHGPDDGARNRNPVLYDYEDQSREIVAEVIALQHMFPDEIFFVVGNHEWSHVGGPRTRKFHVDEAKHLESAMSLSEIRALHVLIHEAYLAISTPCGALLCHGSPAKIPSFEALNEIDFAFLDPRSDGFDLVSDVITAYGQSEADTRAMLNRLSSPSAELRFVLHGHDRDEKGIFFEENNQVCVVIFGAPRHEKRFVVLDLTKKYELENLKAGNIVRRLYP